MSAKIALNGLKVVLINLERSTERMMLMKGRLHKLNLTYEWLRAIDGEVYHDELMRSVNAQEFSRNVGRDILPGEIGCYHSHLEAWKLFLKGDNDALLVLEDDVVFGDDFLNVVHLALKNRDQWDMLKLNCIRAKHQITQAKWGSYTLNAYLGPFTGMGAYLIQRQVVQRLLESMLPITRPIDHELDRIHIHDFRHFGIEPFPSHVDDGNRSTITGVSFDRVKKYPWYRRRATYQLRLQNSVSKILYLWKKRGRYPSTTFFGG